MRSFIRNRPQRSRPAHFASTTPQEHRTPTFILQLTHAIMASPIPTSFSSNPSAQESFVSNYDLDNPMEAISSYSRLIHQHTKRQMELAIRSSTRRSDQPGVSAMSQLSTQGSVDSVDSVNQS